MHRKHLIGFSFTLLLAIACASEDAPAEKPTADGSAATESNTGSPTEASPLPIGDNSRTSLDWAGTYSGVVPCASCPGIETVVTLRDDGTFEHSMLYIDESPIPETRSGTFTWNDAGGKVTLKTGGNDAQQYQVGENQLFHLDQQGERITGELAGHYVLQKHGHDSAIEDRRWKLVELRGTRIEAGRTAQEAVFTLSAGESVASGSASCNTFSAPYAIKTGQRIQFGRNMAVTMMACPDMGLESEFLDVLKQVDNYSLGDDGSLSLNRARMAPLARFDQLPGTLP